MTWNSIWPLGTTSVKNNRASGQQNTAYMETKQKLDHYWNENANNDGHHRYVEMPNITAASRPSGIDVNKDPSALAAGQTCLLYTRKKTPTESPGAQYDEPYVYTEAGAVKQYMQLGFHVMVHFTISGPGDPSQAEVLYSHNLATQTDVPKGVKRDGTGLYTLNFAKDLPSANYILFGSAMRSSDNPTLNVAIATAAAKTTSMNKSWVKIAINSTKSGSLSQPLVVMVSICGG